MIIKLSKDALGALPEPDSQGLVRVSATVRISGQDGVELLEINDAPVSESSAATDDENPMPILPDANEAPNSLY